MRPAAIVAARRRRCNRKSGPVAGDRGPGVELSILEVWHRRWYDWAIPGTSGGEAMERTFTARSELEAILLEQAQAMARELEAVTDAAPDGRVLAVAELAAVRGGRELARRALEAALQRQAAAAEKK